MKSIYYKSLIISLLMLPSAIMAQQPTGGTKDLGNEDITVVKDYTPVLNDAFKINIIPSGDTGTVQAPALSYHIDPKVAYSNYNITPIKPVRIKDDNIKKLYRGWIKAGYGLENMPLLDFSFNSLRSKSFDAGINYHHLSSTGAINDYGSPANSSNKLGVFGTKYLSKFSLGAEFKYDREVVHYYGFDSPPELFTKAETIHSMNDLSGAVKLQSLGFKKDQWQYDGNLGFYAFSDNISFTENNFNISGNISNNTNVGLLSIMASVDAGSFKNELVDYNRSIIRFNPRLTIAKDLYKIDLGANLAYEANDGEGDIHLYPVLKASYQIINDAFKVFAEISGDLQRNDVRSFSKENPFYGNYTIPTNTNQALSFSGGLSAKLDHDLMFTASASFSNLKDQPFYFGYQGTDQPLEFGVLYDDATKLTIRGEMEYKMAEKILASFDMEINTYNTENLSHALYAPLFRLGVHGQYNIAEKIYLKADFYYNGEVYAMSVDSISTIVADYNYTKLKSYFDANLGVDYRFSKVLSFFATLNNLGFSQYFKWENYPSYRFTAMVGGAYSF